MLYIGQKKFELSIGRNTVILTVGPVGSRAITKIRNRPFESACREEEWRQMRAIAWKQWKRGRTRYRRLRRRGGYDLPMAA